jgi:hypothetical protein
VFTRTIVRQRSTTADLFLSKDILMPLKVTDRLPAWSCT